MWLARSATSCIQRGYALVDPDPEADTVDIVEFAT